MYTKLFQLHIHNFIHFFYFIEFNEKREKSLSRIHSGLHCRNKNIRSRQCNIEMFGT